MVNGNGEEVNFTSPSLVASRMEELKQKYMNEWQDLTVFERAVKHHMAIINIHPFRDENDTLVKNATYPQNVYKLRFSN